MEFLKSEAIVQSIMGAEVESFVRMTAIVGTGCPDSVGYVEGPG